jgi:hypothetical protein
MSTHRVFPPAGSHVAWEGVYNQTAGQYADVADTVAKVMAGAGGWTDLGEVGTTAARPAIPQPQPNALGSDTNQAGRRFLDTSLGTFVWWDGQAYRVASGAAV